jgi:hypothetical protein
MNDDPHDWNYILAYCVKCGCRYTFDSASIPCVWEPDPREVEDE